MKSRSELSAVLCALAACGLARSTFAQSSTDWSVPAAVQTLDFRSQSPERKALFLDDGLAYEITLDFMIIQHKKVALEAALGEPGEFRVEQANPRAQVDVKNVRTEAGQGKAEVEGRVAAVGRSDATARAREAVARLSDPVEKELAPQVADATEEQMRSYLTQRKVEVPHDEDEEAAKAELRRLYLQERTLEHVLPDFRRALIEIAERKPGWVSAADKLQWERTDDRTLVDEYHRLVEYAFKDDHLRRLGLGSEGNPDFATRLDSRFDAVNLAMSGKIAQDPEPARRVAQILEVQDLRRLRDALRVELRCRFYPATDPNDPNAQWFNAQRVACQAKQVASIRVEGKLDPTEGDRVDWWSLEDYDAAQILLDVQQAPGFRVDPPFRAGEGVQLRVVATDQKPVSYALEFRPRKKKEGLAVVIHESPPAADTGFPY